LARLGRYLGCTHGEDAGRLVGGNRHSISYPELHPWPERLGVKSGAIHSPRTAMAALVVTDLGFISIRPQPCRPVDWTWRAPTGQRHRNYSVRDRKGQAFLWSESTDLAGSCRRRGHVEGYSTIGNRVHREHR